MINKIVVKGMCYFEKGQVVDGNKSGLFEVVQSFDSGLRQFSGSRERVMCIRYLGSDQVWTASESEVEDFQLAKDEDIVSFYLGENVGKLFYLWSKGRPLYFSQTPGEESKKLFSASHLKNPIEYFLEIISSENTETLKIGPEVSEDFFELEMSFDKSPLL